MLLKLSPSHQLFVAAVAGAMAAALVDFYLNGSCSGVAKAAARLAVIPLPTEALLAAGWTAFALAGVMSCFFFRPLTLRSAFLLAFGSAAVLTMIVPSG